MVPAVRTKSPLKAPQDLADADLVDGCLKGDQQSWESLIRKYQNLIYSVPINYRFSVQDAADVFQSVCVILLKNLKTLRSVETLSAWIYVTTRRQCWKMAKKTRMEVELVDFEQQAEEPVAEKLVLQRQVRGGLSQLSEKCRDLLKALYYSDPPLSYEEITRDLGIPYGSIGPTRARCLERLQKVLKKRP
jgi:RNA polymerase sigma factor (sigma-70 family)